MNRLSSPLDVQIELTEACNQNCRHCYNYWRQEKKPPIGELSTNNFLNVIKQIHLAKVGSVTLTGGEPMLRKNLLFDMVSKLHNLNMDVGLNSNGILINKESAKILAKCGLNHALISVLGTETLHNSIAGTGGDFTKTIQGIKNLLNVGIDVAVNMPVSKINLSSVWKTAKFIKEIGVKKFCSEPIVPSCKSNISLCLSIEECKIFLKELIRVSSKLKLDVVVLEPLARCLFNSEEEKEFVRFFGNRICSAAVSSCAISSKGEMRPCIQSDVLYGNVLPNNFLDVWKKMKQWSSPEILPKKCIKCNALMVCEGGCRMSAKIFTGSYNGQDMYMREPISDPKRVVMLP
ncbi:MAG: radical SAM protein [bacterium]